MRLASYNIMSGGFDDYDHTAPTPQRLSQLQQAVRLLDADIISLVDTFRWDELFDEAALQELFGYPYVRCINLNDDRLRKLGHNNGITVLSKQPFIHARTLMLPGRDCLDVTVRHDDTNIRIFCAYLDDISEDTRLLQAKTIVDSLDPQQPTLLMGDLNSFSPAAASEHDVLLKGLLAFPEVTAKLAPVIGEMARAELIPYLLQHGFRDADTAARPTFPTALFPYPLPNPLIRIDYCLHTAGLRIDQLVVHTDSIFDETERHTKL